MPCRRLAAQHPDLHCLHSMRVVQTVFLTSSVSSITCRATGRTCAESPPHQHFAGATGPHNINITSCCIIKKRVRALFRASNSHTAIHYGIRTCKQNIPTNDIARSVGPCVARNPCRQNCCTFLNCHLDYIGNGANCQVSVMKPNAERRYRMLNRIQKHPHGIRELPEMTLICEFCLILGKKWPPRNAWHDS